MKTKDQILKHLEYTGYTQKDSCKIIGYLLGAGIVEKGENVHFCKGESDFNDFFEWVNKKEPKNIFADIAANLDYLLDASSESKRSIPTEILNKTKKNVMFLLENKEYLQKCIDEKNICEEFDKEVKEILKGLNGTLTSIYGK